MLQDVPIRVAPLQTYSLVLPAALNNLSVSFSCGKVAVSDVGVELSTDSSLGSSCSIGLGPSVVTHQETVLRERGFYVGIEPADLSTVAYTVGVSIVPIQLYPRASVIFLNNPLQYHTFYACTKPLPPGISLNPHSGVISGTPLVPFNRTSFVFRLEDEFSHAGITVAIITVEAVQRKSAVLTSSDFLTKLAIGLVVGIGGLILVVVVLFCFLVRSHRRKHGPYNFGPLLVTLGETVTLQAELRTPKEIKREKIKMLEMLGEGNYGKVHKALFVESSGMPSYIVAVKMLHDVATSIDHQGMMHEALLMAQFDHPCVVGLIGVVTVEEPLLVVIEYCEHGALNKYLRRSIIPRREKYGLSSDCADGLAYLGKRGFVHRDIAARNVLVSSDRRAKISDFGLSREIMTGSTYYRMRSNGDLPVRWTAPEALESGRFTEQSDCWSFGVLLWEIWSDGQDPYGEVESNQVVWMYVTDGYRLKQPKRCPVGVFELMQKCWLRSPFERPPMADCAMTLKDMATAPQGLQNARFLKLKTSVENQSATSSSSDDEPTQATESLDAVAEEQATLIVQSGDADENDATDIRVKGDLVSGSHYEVHVRSHRRDGARQGLTDVQENLEHGPKPPKQYNNFTSRARLLSTTSSNPSAHQAISISSAADETGTFAKERAADSPRTVIEGAAVSDDLTTKSSLVQPDVQQLDLGSSPLVPLLASASQTDDHYAQPYPGSTTDAVINIPLQAPNALDRVCHASVSTAVSESLKESVV